MPNGAATVSSSWAPPTPYSRVSSRGDETADLQEASRAGCRHADRRRADRRPAQRLRERATPLERRADLLRHLAGGPPWGLRLPPGDEPRHRRPGRRGRRLRHGDLPGRIDLSVAHLSLPVTFCLQGFRRRSTAPEILHTNGYQTIAFTDGGNVSAKFGFDRGFDVYHENRNGPKGLATSFPLFESWLREKRPEPFLAFLHTYDIHAPYAPPPPYDTLFFPEYSER